MTPRSLVIINPDGLIIRRTFPGRAPTYDALRAAVGGLIQPIRVRYDGALRQAYVDEEGLIKRLAQNDTATKLFRETNRFNADVIVGPIVIVC